jgi:hypothetical protein
VSGNPNESSKRPKETRMAFSRGMPAKAGDLLVAFSRGKPHPVMFSNP